jgi:hypothetical protein
VVLAGVLLAGLVATSTTAADAAAGQPCTHPDPGARPASCSTAVYDTFPGARTGERTTPAAIPAKDLAAKGVTANAVGPQLVACDGDGISGKRVEVLYLREATMPDRYTQFLPMFRAWLADADDQFNDQAAVSNQSRHLRFVTTAVDNGCAAVVHNLVVPAGALATLDSSKLAVQALGYSSTDRKYLMLTEATSICGVGEIQNDDSTGVGNLNNGQSYARVDAIPGCFGPNAIAHELGHTLGAVQLSAAHSDGGWHCLDQWDLMCYGGTPSWKCLQWQDYRLPDCNRDDYFNAAPTAGSYLATHWNTANSAYFIAGGTADVTTHPKAGWTYAITSVSTGEAIEPIGASTSGLVQMSQRTRVDTPSQQWLMGYTTGLQFINSGSRMCMDSSYSGTTPGTTTLQYNCNGQDGMRFAYLPVGSGQYAIFDWLSGLALTVTGAYPAPIQQQVYTGASNQKWIFNRITDPGPVNNGVYYLQGIGNLENAQVADASTVSGALINHAAPSGAASQRWKLQASGSYWKLLNVNSNLCLDLVAASTSVGTQVRQATCATGTRQEWTLRRVADGTYFLVNHYSGKVLNMTTGSLSTLNQQTITGDNRSLIWALRPVYGGKLVDANASIRAITAVTAADGTHLFTNVPNGGVWERLCRSGAWDVGATKVDANGSITSVASAVDPTGTLHLFTVIPNSGVSDRTYSNGTWGSPTTVDTNGSITTIASAVDSAGTLHLFMNIPGSGVWHRTYSNGTWGSSRHVDTNGSITTIASAVDSAGTLHLLTNVPGSGVWDRAYSNGTWATSATKVDANGSITGIAAITAEDGKTHLITVVPTGGAYDRTFSNGTWSGSATNVDSRDNIIAVAISAAPDGMMHLLLNVGSSGVWDHVYTPGS